MCDLAAALGIGEAVMSYISCKILKILKSHQVGIIFERYLHAKQMNT
jgi:hypothetical protein